MIFSKYLKYLSAKGVFYIGTLGFCLTIPYGIIFNNIAIYVMVVAWLSEGGFKNKICKIYETKLILLLVGFCFINAFSLFYSSNLYMGGKELETKAGLLVIPILVIGSSLSNNEIVKLLKSFVFTIIGTCLLCLFIAAYNFIITKNSSVFFYHELSKPIGLSAIYLGNYAAFAIIIIYYLKDVFRSRFKWVFITSFFLFIILLSALSALVFILSFFFAEIFLHLYHRFSFSKTFILMSTMIFFLSFLISSFPYTKFKIEKMKNLKYEMDYPDSAWNSITIRLAKWRCSSDVIKENLWLGVGAGDEVDELMKSYKKNNFIEGIRNRYNSHNQYLSVLIAIGLVGFAVFFCILLIPLLKGLKKHDYILVGFITLIACFFLTENVLSVQKGVVFFSFFYALLIKKTNNPDTVNTIPLKE